MVNLFFFMIMVSFYHYGHSFPRRLYQLCRAENKKPCEFLGLPEDFVYIEGHGGLTLERVLDDPDHYLSRMVGREIDVLSVDLGSNDLCEHKDAPSDVLDKVYKFLDVLDEKDIKPKFIVFLSVIQRSKMWPNHVTLSTYCNRVRTFNRMLAKAFKENPTIIVWSQHKVNLPKYLVDGTHLTEEGTAILIKTIRHMFATLSNMVKEL